MLIIASCGRGKSTYALNAGKNGLLADINKHREKINLLDRNQKDIQPNEMLVVSSRTNTVNQFLKNKNAIKAIKEDFSFDCGYMREQERKGKILVATAHQFGEWVKAGYIIKAPKIIVLDELHSLIRETQFADSLAYIIFFIEEHYNDLIKIGLTATPQFLINYIENTCETPMKFKILDIDKGKIIGAKYKAKTVKVLVNGKGKTILNAYNNKIDNNNKAIYYVQSASQCYKLAKEYGDKAGFIISKYNDTATNEDGELLSDIMEQQGIRDYIINNEKIPDNINIIFLNASCREGLNIKDEKVKYIFCESPDLITIEQVLGRIRNNTEEFIVIANYNNYQLNEKSIKELVKFIEKLNNSVNKSGEMGERYSEQKYNKNLQKFVFKYNGDYRFNRFAKANLQYIQESYIQISNRYGKKYISQIGDRLMLMTEDYFKQLEKYAEDGNVLFDEVITETIKVNHNNAIEKFREIENEWLNKPIGKDEKKQLCDMLAVIRSNGSGKSTNAGWTTIKQMLINNGYNVKQKRIGSKNYDIIFT